MINTVIKELEAFIEVLDSEIVHYEARDDIRSSLYKLYKGTVNTAIRELKKQIEFTKILCDQRDDALQAFSHAYFLVTDKSPVFSKDFGYDEAHNEISSTVNCLKKAVKNVQSDLDYWKEVAKEYMDCLQPLVMTKLYNHCKPKSHSWPGKKHVVNIVEGVDVLLDQIESLRNTIGQPDAGSHPDEMAPRGTAWHGERRNWIAEVSALRTENYNLRIQLQSQTKNSGDVEKKGG